jgi:hypothetical protein
MNISIIADYAFLVVFIFLVIWGVKYLRDIARYQYRSMVLQHRPRLVVRRVFLQPMEVGFPITVQYDVANTGGSAARIVQLERSLWIGSEGKFIDINGSQQRVEKLKNAHLLKASEAFQGSVRGKVDLTESMISQINTTTATAGINLVGVIGYQDEIGIKRRTAFWRRYDPLLEKPQFVTANDADAEYAD